MKAYLKNIPVRLRNFNKLIDAKTYLCDKPWVVLNDGQTKELYIFRNNGDLILTRNGIALIGHYTILPVDKILIDIDGNNYLFNPLISRQYEVLALKLDGNEQYSFLIDEQSNLYNNIKIFSDFEQMLLAQERRQIEAERKETERKVKENEEKEKQAFYAAIGLGYSWITFYYMVMNVIVIMFMLILSAAIGCVLSFVIGILVLMLMGFIYINFQKRWQKYVDIRNIKKQFKRMDLSDKQRKWLNEYLMRNW